ncbi:caspase family protein [Streptomyces sp. PKU-EA00015]|uniref:caspase family protein n=1 Tax=Streptomyces sp. PKU-EA00015 TaxID=2748326 RepID=UPI0015A2F99B|nr:caspase family protein [Streptomyces sp. PKU-EA00015]NWF31064.1 caspase family protein [Streptomyces sp. PKU-EA00015]
MTVRLPEPRGSRAVLIGTSNYESPDLRPLLAVRNNLEVLHDLLVSENGGFLPGTCAVVQDSSDPQGVCRTIREAAREAPDTLLVYFSGHGILSYEGELHLALAGTDQADLRWTSVPVQEIRHIFETAACRNKVLILDCCHSGWVLDAMMSAPNSEAAPLDIRGTYVLVSSSADLASYAPPEDRYTAFTGELIKLLRDGVPGAPELLPLSALFAPLTAAMKRRSLPRPRQQGSDGHASLALVRNMSAGSGTREADQVQQAGREGESGRIPEVRLGYETLYRRLFQWGIGLPLGLGLLWPLTRFGPAEWKQAEDPTSLQGIVLLLSMGGILIIVSAMIRARPASYSLIVSADGVEVRYGESGFYYPWHRVSRVWVVARPRGKLRGTQYALLVQPKPGVLVKTARRGTPGPRRDTETGALRFANLRSLNKPPAVVEWALAQHAGSAWTRSSGPLDPAVPTQAGEGAVQGFSADRRLLALATAVSVGLAYAHFPTSALVRPATLWLTIVPVLLSVAACGVAWCCVCRIVQPVRLEISAAGVALTRGKLKIEYAWTEIEQIGIVNCARGPDLLGLLAVRTTPRADQRPADRTITYLPKLDRGCVSLCRVAEVTWDPLALRWALRRFAAESQVTSEGHVWLRSAPAKTKSAARATVAVSGTTFEGVRSFGAAWVIAIALGLPSASLHTWALENEVPVLLDSLDKSALMPLPVVGLLAYYLTGRHRVSLHIGASGLTVTAFGLRMHTVRVPWGDIENIGLVARQHATSYSLVLWLRPGARPPRSLWWLCPQEHGGRRLISVGENRLDTTPDQLDRVIANHAGHRHSRMQRRP